VCPVIRAQLSAAGDVSSRAMIACNVRGLELKKSFDAYDRLTQVGVLTCLAAAAAILGTYMAMRAMQGGASARPYVLAGNFEAVAPLAYACVGDAVAPGNMTDAEKALFGVSSATAGGRLRRASGVTVARNTGYMPHHLVGHHDGIPGLVFSWVRPGCPPVREVMEGRQVTKCAELDSVVVHLPALGSASLSAYAQRLAPPEGACTYSFYDMVSDTVRRVPVVAYPAACSVKCVDPVSGREYHTEKTTSCVLLGATSSGMCGGVLYSEAEKWCYGSVCAADGSTAIVRRFPKEAWSDADASVTRACIDPATIVDVRKFYETAGGITEVTTVPHAKSMFKMNPDLCNAARGFNYVCSLKPCKTGGIGTCRVLGPDVRMVEELAGVRASDYRSVDGSAVYSKVYERNVSPMELHVRVVAEKRADADVSGFAEIDTEATDEVAREIVDQWIGRAYVGPRGPLDMDGALNGVSGVWRNMNMATSAGLDGPNKKPYVVQGADGQYAATPHLLNAVASLRARIASGEPVVRVLNMNTKVDEVLPVSKPGRMVYCQTSLAFSVLDRMYLGPILLALIACRDFGVMVGMSATGPDWRDMKDWMSRGRPIALDAEKLDKSEADPTMVSFERLVRYVAQKLGGYTAIDMFVTARLLATTIWAYCQWRGDVWTAHGIFCSGSVLTSVLQSVVMWYNNEHTIQLHVRSTTDEVFVAYQRAAAGARRAVARELYRAVRGGAQGRYYGDDTVMCVKSDAVWFDPQRYCCLYARFGVVLTGVVSKDVAPSFDDPVTFLKRGFREDVLRGARVVYAPLAVESMAKSLLYPKALKNGQLDVATYVECWRNAVREAWMHGPVVHSRWERCADEVCVRYGAALAPRACDLEEAYVLGAFSTWDSGGIV